MGGRERRRHSRTANHLSMESKEDSAEAKTSGIQVYLRIRPSHKPSNFIERDDVDVNRISFQVPKQEDAIVNNTKSSYGFQFNGILDEKAKQKEVFKTIGMPVIKNALAGYNSTIFAVSFYVGLPQFHSLIHLTYCLFVPNNSKVRTNWLGQNFHHHGRARKIRGQRHHT